VVGSRVFTAGTTKQIHAFAKATGRLIWSHDLVKDFGAPATLTARRQSDMRESLAYKDTIILSAGGEGQAVDGDPADRRRGCLEEWVLSGGRSRAENA